MNKKEQCQIIISLYAIGENAPDHADFICKEWEAISIMLAHHYHGVKEQKSSNMYM